MKKTIAIIGCGRIADGAHFPALSKIEGVKVKYACDLIIEKAQKAKEKYPELVDQVITDFDFGASEDVTTMIEEVQSHGGKATELIIGMPLVASHHNERFDIDERVIGIGARCLAQLALEIGAKSK